MPRTSRLIGYIFIIASEVTGCTSTNRAVVQFPVWREPSKPMPNAVKTVAVYDSNQAENGASDDSTAFAMLGERIGSERMSRDISTRAGDFLAQRLQQTIDARSLPIRIVNRRDFRLML